MIPGNYSVCRVVVPEDGPNDLTRYETLMWGYDTVAQAYAAFEEISAEEDVPLADLAVVRVWFNHDLEAGLDADE